MNKYIETLDNIKAPEDLKERTVVSMINLQGKTHRFYGKKLAVLIITVIVLAVMGTFTVIAYNNCIYDPTALNFSTEYLGDGIVNINVYNGTDKDVKFQNNYKLCRWTTGELKTVSDEKCNIKVSTCKSKHSITIKINLNNLYDVEALEKEVLVNDWYYIIVTNKNFVHEHDWQCSFRFNNLGEEQEKELKLQQEQKKKEAEESILSSGYFDSIDEKYMFYFESELMNAETQQKYFDMVANDIKNLDGNYVSATSTDSFPEKSLYIKDVNSEVTFDNIGCNDTEGISYLSLNGQLCMQDAIKYLNMLGEPYWDNNNGKIKFNKKMGCMQIKVAYKDNLGFDGFSTFPVFYMVSYKTEDIKSPGDYCFIHGRFYQFKDLEDLKVYQDEKYTIYNINQFLFTDPEQYIQDYMFDVKKGEEERYYQRALNVYNYFNENIKDCFVYLDN